MKCVYCKNQVDVSYRVNCGGDVFCNDECYENQFEIDDRSMGDHDHPYIDSYENVLSEYLSRLNNWEDEMNLVDSDFVLKADELCDTIDEFIEQYFHFYTTQGDDGVFAYEIYNYLLKLQDLQGKILEWRPSRDKHYNIVFLFDQKSFETAEDHPSTYKKLGTYLKKHYPNNTKLTPYLNAGFVKDGYKCTSNNDFELTFDDEGEAKEVVMEFREVFNESKAETLLEPSYLCDCGCGLFLAENDAYDEGGLEGWYYDQLCASLYFPGVYPKKYLENDILCDRADDVTEDITPNYWFYFVHKVKRSCRVHEVDYPDWIELGY